MTFLFKQGHPQNKIQTEMTTMTTFKQCSGGHIQVIIDLKSTIADLVASLEGIGGHLQAILELIPTVAGLKANALNNGHEGSKYSSLVWRIET